ncbi:DNA-3-methyladenine glycosylase 2 family protein [Bombella sp. TMW 2.2559]|uniref:DNA-3-methyladenine glycosylase II n=1 Tax=Bombella dulcis TaxID=2967339 RepID=A0ABT3WF87_9PROT|nr:DNA-3-methyladenine glycosylase 2 family protein [Bombella dulcis]MCX5616472.1 DNA-3-methyladenine glycosylase 2 family protein [Bombella dulcis]
MFSLPPCFTQDANLAAFIAIAGPCRLPEQITPDSQTQTPYASLIKAVTGQQLHNAAARTIFRRLCALGADRNENGPPPAPQELLALEDDTLRRCGLSAAKIASLRAIARGRLEGVVPSPTEARQLDDATLIRQLTSLRGVGQWTVEMLLIFHLGRPDVLPAGDLGVQEGWKRLKKLPLRPTPRQLREATASFSPHRSTLTWYCWQAKALLPDPAPSSKKP